MFPCKVKCDDYADNPKIVNDAVLFKNFAVVPVFLNHLDCQYGCHATVTLNLLYRIEAPALVLKAGPIQTRPL